MHSASIINKFHLIGNMTKDLNFRKATSADVSIVLQMLRENTKKKRKEEKKILL